MANKPCFGVAICPYCKSRNPIFWNGNYRHKCFKCSKPFNIKRQKLTDVEYPRG